MSVVASWSGDGLTPGPLTTSTAGAGDTPPSSIGGGGTVSVVNAGPRQPRIRIDHNAAAYAEWTFPTQSAGAGRFYYTPTSSALAGNVLYILRLTEGSTIRIQVDVTVTGRFNLRNSASVLQQGPADTITPGDTYRIEWVIAATGAVQVVVYEGDGTTAVTTLSGNIGTTTHNTARLGFVAGGAGYDGLIDLDDILITDTSTLPGPWTPPAATNVYYGIDGALRPAHVYYGVDSAIVPAIPGGAP